MRYLSKTKYLEGLQCPKLLWCKYNQKDVFPPIASVLQFAFDEGNRVGRLAQKLFPGARFEAGLVYKNTYARADILAPAGDNVWDLIEVKSSTSVKEEHLHDAAFQRYVFEGAGLQICRCYVMYINKDFVRCGEVDPAQFFLKEDVTKQTAILSRPIEKAVEAMLKTINSPNVPSVAIGPYCLSPHECPLIDLCWKDLPPGNIFDLHQGGQRCFDLMEQGVLKVIDVPADYKLNAKQVIQIEAQRNNQPYIDQEAIRKFLSTLDYPLYFLDFETIAPAIPVYDHCGPYKSVPFQFSLFKVEAEGQAHHFSYLAPGQIDPRPEILRRLKDGLNNSGSIIAYNASFEKRCLHEAAVVYPEYADWAKSLDARFVDLLAPFKDFSYYHPKQLGSASLKNVLPAMTGLHYGELEINNGGAASAEYYKVTFNNNIAEDERRRVRAALGKYCDLDTEGMIAILEALKKVAQK